MVGISRCVLPPLQGSWPVRSGAVLRVTRPEVLWAEALTKAATQCAARHLPAVHGPSPDALAACALALLGPSPCGRPVRCVARGPAHVHRAVHTPLVAPQKLSSPHAFSACRDSSPHAFGKASSKAFGGLLAASTYDGSSECRGGADRTADQVVRTRHQCV